MSRLSSAPRPHRFAVLPSRLPLLFSSLSSFPSFSLYLSFEFTLSFLVLFLLCLPYLILYSSSPSAHLLRSFFPLSLFPYPPPSRRPRLSRLCCVLLIIIAALSFPPVLVCLACLAPLILIVPASSYPPPPSFPSFSLYLSFLPRCLLSLP